MNKDELVDVLLKELLSLHAGTEISLIELMQQVFGETRDNPSNPDGLEFDVWSMTPVDMLDVLRLLGKKVSQNGFRMDFSDFMGSDDEEQFCVPFVLKKKKGKKG